MHLFNKNSAKEGKELSISNLIEVISKLENDNNLLNDKVHEQDEMIYEITQNNAHFTDKVEELESDLKTYEKNEAKGKKSESDVYMETMIENALDKSTKEREIYKKTINKMCEQFGIDHSEVFNIIDSIKNEKDSKIEMEK